MRRPEFVALVVVTLLVRLGGMLVVDYQLSGDGRTYQLLATNLLQHQTFSLSAEAPFVATVLRPPLYPALLAAVEALTGPVLWGVQLVQLVLSTAAATLLGFAVRRVLRRRDGRVVSWALALDPFEGAYVAAFLTEALSAFLVSAGVAALIVARGRKRLVLAGVAAGLAALTRDVFLVLPLAVAALVCWRELGRKRRRGWQWLVAPLTVTTAAALTFGGWTARNAIVTGHLVPVAAGGIEYNAWIGSWEASPDWINGGITNYPDSAFPTLDHHQRFDALHDQYYEPEARALMLEMAKLNWQREPVRAALRCVKRLRWMWFGTRSELFRYRLSLLNERGTPAWKALKVSQWGLNAVVVALGLAFFVAAAKLGRRARLLAWSMTAPLAVTAVAYLPMHSVESRYSQPVLQLLLVGAVVVGLAVWKRVTSVRNSSSAAPGSAER